MASGDVTEVVPGQVWQGITDFSEFPSTPYAAAIPAGITGFQVSIPTEYVSFGFLDDLDPDTGRYFSAVAANVGSNQFAAFGIDSFLATANQGIIEMLCRVRTPAHNPGGTWIGPAVSIVTGGWHKADCLDDASPTGTFTIEGGTDGSSNFFNSSVINRQPGEWLWIRYRRAGLTPTGGTTTLKMKIWYGAFADEPSPWLVDNPGQGINVGPFGFEAIGLSVASLGSPNRVHDVSFLSFTTGTLEADLDAYPPPGPESLLEVWTPLDPVNTTWGSCEAIVAVDIALTSTGLVFRDQFARADAQALGNGWADWEGAATQIQIVSEQVVAAAVASKTGGARPALEVGGTDPILVQMNVLPTASSIGGVRSRWNGLTNTLGYVCRLDTRSGGQWAVVKNNVTVLGSTATDPPLPGEWRGIRVVHDGNVIRMLKTPILASGADLGEEFTAILTPTDGSIITTEDQTGFEHDQLAVVVTFDEFILCISRFIIVNGLPTGYKVRVDARASVVESGGVATLDALTWALPATTVNVLDVTDTIVASITPPAGVWGGDVYDVTGLETLTVWQETCD